MVRGGPFCTSEEYLLALPALGQLSTSASNLRFSHSTVTTKHILSRTRANIAFVSIPASHIPLYIIHIHNVSRCRLHHRRLLRAYVSTTHLRPELRFGQPCAGHVILCSVCTIVFLISVISYSLSAALCMSIPRSNSTSLPTLRTSTGPIQLATVSRNCFVCRAHTVRSCI